MGKSDRVWAAVSLLAVFGVLAMGATIIWAQSAGSTGRNDPLLQSRRGLDLNGGFEIEQAVNAAIETQPAKGKPIEAVGLKGRKLSSPYTVKNLTVVLIHGPDTIKDGTFLTLEEAMATGKFRVLETSNVNRLIVDNDSDKTVFIQSGDIVKGGKQDRVVQYDYVIAPKSGKTEIAVFCVEQGRWRQRGRESVRAFGGSTNTAVGNDLKLAAKLKSDQGEVWKNVSKMQRKLSRSAGGSVQAADAPSSMNASLEDAKVTKLIAEYVGELSGIVKGKTDVIGVAVAINGKVTSVDTYGSAALFAKLWPRLLKAAATEAAVEYDKGLEFEQIAAADVEAFIKAVQFGRASRRRVLSGLNMNTLDAPRNAMFQTEDFESGQTLHENYLSK